MTLAYYGKSRQRQALLAIVTFFAVAIGVVAAGGIGGLFPAARILAQGDSTLLVNGPVSGDGIVPVAITDDENPTCADVNSSWSTFKVNRDETALAGTWDTGDANTEGGPTGGQVVISNVRTISGQVLFDWISNFGVDAVIVKQGSDAHNLYSYSSEDFGDTGLGPSSLADNNGGISHVNFCYDGGEVVTGSIKVIKVVTNVPDDTTVFGGTITSQTSSANWSDSETTNGAAVTGLTLGGPYTVTETNVPEGYSSSNVWYDYPDAQGSCGDVVPPTGNTIPANRQITLTAQNPNQVLCVYNKRLTGRIVVAKVKDPAVSEVDTTTTFGGDITGPLNDSDESPGTWGPITIGGADWVTTEFYTGTYTISEDQPANGWTLVGFALGTLEGGEIPVCPTSPTAYTLTGFEFEVGAGRPLICVMNTKQAQVLTRTITVCKVIDDNGDLTADDRTFNFTVSGGHPTPVTQFSLAAKENSQTTGTAPDCYTFTVDLDALVTITETGSDPAGWVNDAGSGYPKNRVNGDSLVADDNVVVVNAGATCFDNELTTLRRAVEGQLVISPCVVYFYNKQAPPTPRKEFLVCKVVDDNGVLPGNEGGTFTINLSGANVSPTSMTLEQTEGGALAVGSSCEVATADDVRDSVVTITEVVPGGWSSSAGYPKHDVNSGPLVSNDASLEYDVQDCSDVNQQGGLTRATENVTFLPDLCRVTFYNRTDGQVAAAPKLTIKKVITPDNSASTPTGDTPGVNWRFNVQCGTAPAQNNVGPTNGAGSFFFGSPNDGETCTISEVTQAGFGLVGWTRFDTSNNSAGPNTGATNSVTIKMDNDDDNVVTFYNQPLGSITVTKTTVSSHNGGNDVTVAADRDGWKMTLSSAACGVGPMAGHTDTNGVVTFTNLPLCNDYVVTEDVGISGTTGYAVVGSASQSGKTPGNPATQVAFKNRKTSFDPPCTVCTLVIPTPIPPTATPVPPTATPVPNTPTPFSTALGEKTPGAISTPIAPSAGTGAAAPVSTFNALFALVGLVVLGSGLAVVAVGRKQR